MNTPTPSAHSGEQGKPSDVSLARYAADRIDDECIDGLRVQAGHLEVWQTFARLWTSLRKHLSAMDASPTIAREQAGIAHSEGCAISDEVVERVAKIVADHVGHGMREKCEGVARDVLQSAFPRGVAGGGDAENEGYPGIAHDFETMRMQLKAARYFFASPGSFSQQEFQEVGRTIFGCKEYTGRLPGDVPELAHPAPEAQAEGGPPFALPVEVDSMPAHENYKAYALYDANGKSICDTLNSDLIEVHTEIDDDGAYQWDEVGRKNMEYIASVLNRPQPSASETPSGDFESVLRPVVQWLNANGSPHMSIVVTTTGAELLSGQQAFETFDYVRG